MIYQEMYIENGHISFRNTTLEQWLENVNWKQHGWIHHIINRKGRSAFYDLNGAETVKQIHKIYKP